MPKSRRRFVLERSIGLPTHAVIWIDHQEARIFHVHPDSADETTVLAPQQHLHRHPKPDGSRHFAWIPGATGATGAMMKSALDDDGLTSESSLDVQHGFGLGRRRRAR